MARIYNTQIKIAPGVQPDHAVTLQQMEDYVSGKTKDPVRVVSIANLVGTYSGATKAITASANAELEIDSITLAVNDRILLTGQTDKTQNGIYTVTNTGSASAPFILTRAADFDSSSDIFPGIRIAVSEGAIHDDTLWKLTTDAPYMLDATSLVFVMDTGIGAGGVSLLTFPIVGDEVTTVYPFSYNFGTKNIIHEISNNTTGETEFFDFKRVGINDIEVSCAVPLGTGNDYTLHIIAGE